MQPDTGLSAGDASPARGMPLAPEPSGQPPRSIGSNDEGSAKCAEFERVLAGIASRLSNVADGQFDEVVTGCLQNLVEFLGFDRSTLMAFSEQGSRFQVTHTWAVEGVSVVPSDVLLNAKIPWFTHQIRSGHIVSASSAIDLPAVAAQERAYLLQSGLKSILAIPLLMEGTIVGALSFASVHSPRRWPLGLVARLRLAGEIMALGIRRHQYAQGLSAIAQTMDQVSLDHNAPAKKAARYFRDRAMRLMQAEHQERRRMGQVLHEDVMQILSAVGMFVQSGQNGTPQSPATSKAIAMLQDAMRKLRQLTLELRPETVFEMTLADGVHWLAGQVRRRYDLDVDIHIADTVGPVSDDIRSFLYDSARKLLENVAVHASCKRATLEIRSSDPNYLQLVVTDEGTGFNPGSLQDLPSTGFGLFSIHEQSELLGGMLEVNSAPGRGTRVVVTVPLSESDPV
jgi:signal transduction histidine kinase